MINSVENTPGSRAMEVMETVNKEIIFKKPLTSVVSRSKRKRKMKVLDDETYVDDIGNIIQRDFFPDLEKIKVQNEYLEAIQKNDSFKIRQLNMRYNKSKTPQPRMPSPATFETPENIHQQNEDLPTDSNPDSDLTKENLEEEKDEPKCKLSLDQYLNAHTSQDNDSFEEILELSEKKHREKYKYLYNAEDCEEDIDKYALSLPSIKDQATTTNKPLTLDTWRYRNQNYLMFNPDGRELTAKEESDLVKNKQGINYENTRLKTNPFNDLRSKETLNELAKSQAKVLDGKIGVDGKELLKSNETNLGGYSFVRSPSPSPSLIGTPLMTWGQIEGTPFRLDGSDTPLLRSSGPSFKIAATPRREQIALALAEKVGERNRDEKKKALDTQRRQLSSPSPRPNSFTNKLETMSPAARKLASNHLKISVNSDLIRSSYSSPSFKSFTPKIATTPKRSNTPKLNLGIKKLDNKEISTDDLLQINLPTRKKAADFF